MKITNKINERNPELLYLIEILFKYKLFIVLFTIFTLILALTFSYNRDERYLSTIKLKYTSLPYIPQSLIFSNFESIFFSKNNFDKWKTNENNTRLNYDDISNFFEEEGILFEKDKELGTFLELSPDANFDNDKIIFIQNQKNFQLINDLYNYVKFTNEEFKNDIVNDLIDAFADHKNIFDDNTLTDNLIKETTNTLFLFENYKGLIISHPTYPKIINEYNLYVVIFSSLFFGIFSSIILFMLKEKFSFFIYKKKKNPFKTSK